MSQTPTPEMSRDGRLHGQAVLITGGGSGIGAAIAIKAAAEGAAVLIGDIDESAAHATVDRIANAGGRARGTALDVTKASDCEQFAQTALDEFGRIDTVVANAGIFGAGDAHSLDEDDWARVISINLTGVWLTVKYALPAMMSTGRGSIITMASIGGMIGIPGILPYTAAKGGVIAMTRQIAATYGPNGIRANAICPGTVSTPLVEQSRRVRGQVGSDSELDAQAAAKTVLGRMGTPDDIASFAIYLASDESSWQTGTATVIDGGRTIG